jgi:hypothetical protein
VKPQRAAIGKPLTAVLLLAACAFAGGADAAPLSKLEYRLDHEKAQAAYKLESNNCRKLQANARDVCKVQARGHFQVAKAEVDARHNRTPKHEDKVKLAKAEAAFRLATEKCEDLHGNAQNVCKLDARATWVAARGEASLSRASVDKGLYSRQATSERKDVREDNAAALFAAAKERCDALPGAAKATCVGDAKKRFGL